MTNLNLATSHASRVIHVVQNGLQPAGIEPHVTRSWQRCLQEYHLEPAAPRQSSVLTSHALKELQQRMGELLPVARAEMESMYEQIAGASFCMLVCRSARCGMNGTKGPMASAPVWPKDIP